MLKYSCLLLACYLLMLSCTKAEVSIDNEDTSDVCEIDQDRPKEGSIANFVRKAVFLKLVRSYIFRSREDLEFPSKYGLENAENIFISVPESCAPTKGRLGAWFIKPNNDSADLANLGSGDCLVIYMHGNSFDRGFRHRLNLYKVLTKLGCHVFTFDYRSYGDSSTVFLTEKSVVEDGKHVLQWLEERIVGNLSKNAESPNVVVWGHSLGTSVATRVMSDMSPSWVSGVVLESPFNTMEDELMNFKLSWLAGVLSWWTDLKPLLEEARVSFRTEDYVANVKVPVLVLHSNDDPVVPVALGEKLVKRARQNDKEDIELITWGKEHRLRHRYIYRGPGVETYIQNFISKIETESLAFQ